MVYHISDFLVRDIKKICHSAVFLLFMRKIEPLLASLAVSLDFFLFSF